MKYLAAVCWLLWPIFALAAFPKLPAPNDPIDWTDYAQWPEQIELKGRTYLISVNGGGGCIVHGAPAGTKPSLEIVKKWGSYSAYYEPTKRSEKSYLFDIFGPEVAWGSQHAVIRRSFYNGKGAVRFYDKKEKVFYKEWSFENGHSRGYYDLYGRIALEDRTTITPDRVYVHELFRYRKPCSPNEFKFTKELLMEKFDLYDHPFSQR